MTPNKYDRGAAGTALIRAYLRHNHADALALINTAEDPLALLTGTAAAAAGALRFVAGSDEVAEAVLDLMTAVVTQAEADQ